MRPRSIGLWVALIALAIGLATPAAAQELRGRITGTVTDNTGAVLPGVSVTASGPALIQPQSSVTGADGSYRFPALPTGVFTLTYELAGFQTLKREQIRLGLNMTLTVNVELQLSSLQETVTITGESPTVDVKTTAIGTNFTKELLQDIPNARDIWAAMAQAPGFQMTGFDVGGSHTGTQTGYITYGVGDQNKTFLEGINVTEGTGGNAGYFDFGSFEEFQLGGAGNMGEQAGPGAFLNLTIKSGGDRFAGQFYLDYENDATISDNVPSAFKAPGGVDSRGFKAPTIRDPATGQLLGLARGNPITKQYDLNVNGGGPIKRGKAWFFTSYRDNNQYTTILGLPGVTAQSQLVNWPTLKGTYQISKSNQFIAFYNERSKLQPLRGLSLARPAESAQWQDSKNRPQKYEWTSVLSQRAFLDIQYSYWGNYFPLFPTQTKSTSTEGVPVGRIDLTTNQESGANVLYHFRTTLKPQFSGSLAYFQDNWGGTHNFKFGFEAYRERRKFLRFQPGNIYYRDREGRPSEVDIYNTPNEAADDSNSLSIYVQDGWSVSRALTINAGVRLDHYRLGWPAQSFTPEQTQYFQPVNTPDTTVAKFNSVSPRVGLAWDFGGQGKSVVKAFYGRFYYNPSTDISSLENPVSQSARRYQFNDLNGNRVLDGPQELGRLLSSVGGGGNVRVDRDLEHAWGQEVSTHFERELAEALSARVSYVYKGTRNGWAEVDLARVNAYTAPFPFVDVGPDNIRGTSDDQTLNLFDRPAGTPSQRTFTNPGRIQGVPAYEGDYHTIELALNRRFKDKWLLLTSFEQTWADDFRGTGVGTGTLATVQQGTAFLWQPNRRRLGREATTFWNYKAIGRYVFPWDIGVSGSYKFQSGFNYARTISVSLPIAGSEEIRTGPLKDTRAQNVHIVDVRLEKMINFGARRGKFSAMVDVFNALNANPLTNFRVVTGSRYNEVIALLDPRIVRFGVRYEF
ncbi:MAG: TonB-dependent receptor [Acidobacteria bacterium]|nr:TonB-dependent receptor [Acidobacteriota bacterium]